MPATRRKPAVATLKPEATGPRTDLLIAAAIVLCAFAVYARVFGFDFVNFDDDLYVYDNPVVRNGLTLAGLKWALTAVVSSNWMPVTLVSHMLDVQCFGVNPGPQHLVNVLLHALAAVFLFLALRHATDRRWPSTWVALAFAVHPLHVESVAWIAERKDVLSTFFWFSALYAYVRGRYVTMTILFALGLMSKPMLVTFPFALLLFDIWPLRRFEWPKSIVEKLPLFALSAAASAVSYSVQLSAGAVHTVPLSLRIENALVSVTTYIGQTLWPAHLAIFYPYESAIPGWQIALAAALIAAVSYIVIRNLRERPWLAVGWFWFLGTLVPVIGLVQVGSQSHADRYTYVPMVGLTLMIAGWPVFRRELAIAGALLCAIWMGLAFHQTGYWRNSQTVYAHAIDVTSGNWLAEYNLGHDLMDQKRLSDAIPHFQAVLRIRPDHYEADNNLGSCLMNLGRKAEAVPYFEAALRAKPDFADAHFNLGLDLSALPGRLAEAETEFRSALHYAPDLEQAHNSLGLLLFQTGRAPEAVRHFEAVARLHPGAQAEYNLGAVLATIAGRQSDAISHLETSDRLRPDPQTAKLIAILKANSH